MSKNKKAAQLPPAPPVVDQTPPAAPPVSPPPIVDGALTRCHGCGSTERTKYRNHREIGHSGVQDGQPYTHVVWRDTNCEVCGQRRCDRHFEQREAVAGGTVPESGANDGTENGAA